MTPSFALNAQRFALLVLPICALISAVMLRQQAGPFWLWSNLDPDYFYLFDSLNIINGNWPQHIAHPGTTVQMIGALVIKFMQPFSSTNEINNLVLTNPEHYLIHINHTLICIMAFVMWAAGWAALIVFGNLTGAILLQLGPFLSQLIFKHLTHVSPEPLLVCTMFMLATVMLLAVRPHEMDRRPFRYVFAFALVAGFGLATKITSAGLYLMPLFLIARPKLLILYAIATVCATILFTLPAAGSYGSIFDWLVKITVAGDHFGSGAHRVINTDLYLRNVFRVSSRPIFFVVLILGTISVAVAKLNSPLSQTSRALAGLCLAFAGQALLVGKHPAGHYMIPALTSSGFGFLLLRQQIFNFFASSRNIQIRVKYFFMILLTVLCVLQTRSLIQLGNEFTDRTTQALAIDESPYSSCARIYFWPASNNYYALFMGNYMTGNMFSKKLDQLYTDPAILIATPSGSLSSWTRESRGLDVAAHYNCIFARGERAEWKEDPVPHYVLPFDDTAFVDIKIKGVCNFGDEVIFTWGVECIPSRWCNCKK